MSLSLWWIALLASTIPIAGVALLLGLIAAAARNVDRHARAIRVTGEQIADNTAAIRLLARANDALREIRASVAELDRDTRILHATIAALDQDRP